MINTNSSYKACHGLFARYPLATQAVTSSGRIIRSMILMLRDGDRVTFFVLSREPGEGGPRYTLCPWRAAGVVHITAEGGAVPDAVVDILTRGVPIPQDGSLFGWIHGDAVTALISVSTRYVPAAPQFRWTVMPLAGIPEDQWPPFTGEHFLGPWFWEGLEAGNIVFLDHFIAATPGTVFWADTTSVLGSDACVVAHDTRSPEAYVLLRGCYVPWQALRTRHPVPPLEVLLADPGKIDLAHRFGPAVTARATSAASPARAPSPACAPAASATSSRSTPRRRATRTTR